MNANPHANLAASVACEKYSRLLASIRGCPEWYFNRLLTSAPGRTPSQPLLGQINVALNAAQHLIIDYPLVAEPQHGTPLDLEGCASQLLVARGIQPVRSAAQFHIADLRQYLDALFIFRPQALERL